MVSALSRLADRVGEGPVSLSVSLTDSNEVLSLRARIESLEKELDALRASYNHTEFLYRCEVVVNTELLDLCREHRGAPAINFSLAGAPLSVFEVFL